MWMRYRAFAAGVPITLPRGAIGLDVTARIRSVSELEASSRRESGLAELSRAALAGASLVDVLQGAVALIARELPGVDFATVWELSSLSFATGTKKCAFQNRTGFGAPR